jgi:hypothetical protein
MGSNPVAPTREMPLAGRALFALVAVLLVAASQVHASPIQVAQADASWLDNPTASGWNSPGAAIPVATDDPTGFGSDPRCAASDGRWAETPQDQALVDAGWALFSTHRAGWGIDVVQATTGYDGMCRPVGYQAFVFVDGAFAGTISPEPMSSRTDGAGSVIDVRDAQLSARFVRYAPTDALCCPSLGAVTVEYTIERTPGGPLLRAAQSFKEP